MKTTIPYKLKALSAGLGLAVVLLPSVVNAHGYMTSPMARQAFCAAQGGYWWPADGSNIPNAACRAAFLQSGHYPFTQQPEFAALTADYHNQQAVEQSIPNGTLCAGGDDDKAGMDLPSADWQRTVVTPNAEGNIKIRYRAETPHNPSFWRFYLSRTGFNSATDVLRWDDLELVQSHNNIDFVKDANGHRYYEMYVAIPAHRSGDAVLFSRWQRNDPAGEGFYNCSDITIKYEGDPTGQWSSAGYYIKQGQTAQAGDVVRFRLFSAVGDELINQALKVTSDNANHWQKTLADNLVLDHGRIIRIGVKDTNGDISYDSANILANQVWLQNGDYTYHLSVKPQPANTAPQIHDIADVTMTELAVTTVHVHAFDDENDPLSYQWTIPSVFTSNVEGANLSLVAPAVTADTTYTLSVAVSDGALTTERSFKVHVTNGAAEPWQQNKVYVAGDKVTHEGKTYEAKWWTRGEVPGNALVWKAL